MIQMWIDSSGLKFELGDLVHSGMAAADLVLNFHRILVSEINSLFRNTVKVACLPVLHNNRMRPWRRLVDDPQQEVTLLRLKK